MNKTQRQYFSYLIGAGLIVLMFMHQFFPSDCSQSKECPVTECPSCEEHDHNDHDHDHNEEALEEAKEHHAECTRKLEQSRKELANTLQKIDGLNYQIEQRDKQFDDRVSEYKSGMQTYYTQLKDSCFQELKKCRGE